MKERERGRQTDKRGQHRVTDTTCTYYILILQTKRPQEKEKTEKRSEEKTIERERKKEEEKT